MAQDNRLEDLIIAVALTEFAAQNERTEPELAAYAEHLAEDRLVTDDSGSSP